MRIQHIFLDLDDTVYPSSSGLWEAIRVRMNRYMQEKLQLPLEKVSALRQTYFQTYGTTLRGLQLNHTVDTDEFLAYVHDLPLHEYIHPDPVLVQILDSLPQTISIFTNADNHHAERVLNILGLQASIDSIIDIRSLEFFSKPDPEAYRRALRMVGHISPENCLLIDDSLRNLEQGARFKLRTVWVTSDLRDNIQHVKISSLRQLPDSLPELWHTG